MPGIYGIISKKNQTSDQLYPQFKKMTALLHHFDRYRIESYEGKSFMVGRIGIPYRDYSSLRYDTTHHRGVVFHGFMYGWRGEDRGKDPSLTEPVSFLPLDKKQSLESIPTKINGSFNIFLFDTETNRFHLANSRLGLRNMFYYENDEVFAFAPEMKAFLGIDSYVGELDEEGASDYFNYGFIVDGNTLHKKVKRIDPATLITIAGGKVESNKRYWTYTYTDELNGNLDEWTKRIVNIADAVYRRQVGTHREYVMGLSGGMDSRYMAYLAARDKLDMHYRSHGYRKSDDVRIAGEVARRLGVEDRFFIDEGDPENFHKLGEFSGWLGDFMTFLHTSTLVDILSRYPEPADKFEFMNTQYSGALNFGMAYPNRSQILEEVSFENKMKMAHRIASSDFTNEAYYGFFNPGFRGTMLSNRKRRLEAVMRKHENAGKYFASQFDQFSIETRYLRYANNYDMNRYFYNTHIALVDDEFFELYTQIPLKLSLDRNIYTKIFCDYFPSMAQITYEKTGANLFEKPSKWHKRKKQFYNRFQYYVGRLSKGKINISDPHRYIQHDQWYRKYKKNRLFFENLMLDPKTLQRGFFDPKQVKLILDKQRNGSSMYHVISNMATFELFCRHFLDKEAPPNNPLKHL